MLGVLSKINVAVTIPLTHIDGSITVSFCSQHCRINLVVTRVTTLEGK